MVQERNQQSTVLEDFYIVKKDDRSNRSESNLIWLRTACKHMAQQKWIGVSPNKMN